MTVDDSYNEATTKVKERLKQATEKPPDNSVLNSLRFYTREEQLSEYFCLTCSEGSFSFFFIKLEFISCQNILCTKCCYRHF